MRFGRGMRVGWMIGLFLIGWLSAAMARQEVRVSVTGNEIYSERQILSALPPQEKQLTDAYAERARQALLTFYRRQGYTLARVWVKVHQGWLYIAIDEGKLEKILLIGRGALTTLAIRITFDLPYRVYNERRVAEQVEIFKQRFGIRNVRIEVVESPEVQTVGQGFPDLGSSLFNQKAARYELHLIVPSVKGEGPSLGMDTTASFGIMPQFSYTERNLFFPGDDMLRFGGETGVNYRKNLNSQNWEIYFSHARTDLTYEFPPLAKFLRFSLLPFVDLSNYTRKDLPLAEYWHLVVGGSLKSTFQITNGLSMYVSGGIERKQIFSIVEAEKDPFHIRPFADRRYSVGSGLLWDLRPDLMRIDRHPLLYLSYEHTWTGESRFHRVRGGWRLTFPFGYHDLLVNGDTVLTFGPTPFYDEVAMSGSMLRTFFEGRLYSDMAGWLQFEWRFSLLRDIVKLSIFHDLAGFAMTRHLEVDPEVTTYSQIYERRHFTMANSFGPGFHWLILDTFQLNLYACFGYSEIGWGYNTFARLVKVF